MANSLATLGFSAIKTLLLIHTLLCRSFICNIALCCEQFRAQYAAACGAADRVVGKSDKFPVKQGIFSETSDGDAHALLIVYIQSYLGTVILLKVLDELLRRAGKVLLLGHAAEGAERIDQLLLCGILAEIDRCTGL